MINCVYLNLCSFELNSKYSRLCCSNRTFINIFQSFTAFHWILKGFLSLPSKPQYFGDSDVMWCDALWWFRRSCLSGFSGNSLAFAVLAAASSFPNLSKWWKINTFAWNIKQFSFRYSGFTYAISNIDVF